MADIRIGTSGWSYAEWRGKFYPRGLPRDQWLAHYSQRFATVELNATFYRWPTGAQFARWGDAVPRDFVFSVKAPRSITHIKRLRGCEEELQRLPAAAAALWGTRLGPLLYQLPPTLKVDASLLEDFVGALPNGPAHVIEFRDASWFCDRVLGLLRDHNVALCLSDFPGAEAPRTLTSELAYVRLHGGRRYSDKYDEPALQSWARQLEDWQQRGIGTFVYFNNTAKAHAPENAEQLRRMIGQVEDRFERPEV